MSQRVIYRRTAKPFTVILLHHSFVRIPDAENCPEPAARLLSNDGTEDTSSSNCWHSLDNVQACGSHRLPRNMSPMASVILDNSTTHYSITAPSAAGNCDCNDRKKKEAHKVVTIKLAIVRRYFRIFPSSSRCTEPTQHCRCVHCIIMGGNSTAFCHTISGH